MKTLEQLRISPAPWRADTDKWGSENDVLCEYTRDLVRKGERRTKVVARCNAHFETFKADIRVIAAAPDLYEALAAMLSCVEKEAPFTAGSGMSIAIDMARKAIKKAGGEE